MIWITVPVVVICFYTRGYLARLIFARDAPEIALIFGFLAGAIFFRTIYTIISRWFYAQKDTKTPLFISVFTIALNICLAYFLAKPDSYGVAGLALAQSIVAFVEVLILAVVMVIRDHKLFDADFWSGCARILSVTGFSIVAGFIMVSIFPLASADTGVITLGSKVALISGVIFAVHTGVSAIFDLDEVRPVITRLKQFALRPVRLD
jgi:putative peptidoglycan lipid II flippase